MSVRRCFITKTSAAEDEEGCFWLETVRAAVVVGESERSPEKLLSLTSNKCSESAQWSRGDSFEDGRECRNYL